MSFHTDCLECGKEFEAKRSTAKFCSAKCRQRHNRKHRNQVNVVHEAMTIIDAVERLKKRSIKELYDEHIGTGEDLYNAMMELQAMFISYDPSS